MTIASQKFTFEEYLAYDDGTDTRYELIDGTLTPRSLGTGKHGAIIRFVVQQFEGAVMRSSQPRVALPALVGVRSPRGRNWDTVRIPDVTVLVPARWEAMSDREAVINLNEPPPILVVEVVSPSTKNDDYRSKRSEYGLLEIPEYWIIDPLEAKVSICIVEHQFYDSTEYRSNDSIQSLTFPNLNLTAAQMLAAKL